MKKNLKFIILLFGIFFIGNLNVYADNCTTYACTTCKYAVTDGYITFKVVGDGNGSVTVSPSFDLQSDSNATFSVSNNISASSFVGSNKAQCPKSIYYKKTGSNYAGQNSFSVYPSKSDNAPTEAKLSSEDNNNLTLDGSGNNNDNNNNDNNNNTSGGGTGSGNGGRPSNIKVTINPKQGCQNVLTSELVEWLQWVLDVIRIGGLVLTVILGIVDYVNATFSSKDDSIAKANKNFTTRLMALALLFLVPTLIEFILKLFSISSTGDDPRCGLN